jgi:hypothetical protein
VCTAVEGIIEALTLVHVFGYNLMRGEDATISIRGNVCTSIQLHNDSYATCLMRQSFHQPLQAADLSYTNTAGKTAGITNDSSIVYREGLGRPIIAKIIYEQLPFHPYSMLIADQAIYWTNKATDTDAGLIYRCDRLGNFIETILHKDSSVPYSSINDIAMLPENDNSGNFLVFVDRAYGSLSLMRVAAFNANVLYTERTAVDDIILGLEKPTTIAVDKVTDKLYLACVDGYILRIDITAIRSQSTLVPFSMKDSIERARAEFPWWLKLTTSLSSACRLSSIAIVPTRYPGTWRQQ